jgi:catechol 2,3-dioxygenase-like lactoylglutathione lyase family enzyme
VIPLILYVRDQAAAARFYRAVLRSEPRLDVPGMTEFQLGDEVVLGLMPEAGIARLLGEALGPPPPPGAHRAELYLRVDDPEAGHRRAIAAGARELSPLSPRSWGDVVAYSLDPDGTVLAFASRPS